VVLIGATLLTRSFNGCARHPASIHPTAHSRLPFSLAETPRRAPVAFLRAVMPQLAALPGVRSVGASSGLPLVGLDAGVMFAVADVPRAPTSGHGADPLGHPDYFVRWASR